MKSVQLRIGLFKYNWMQKKKKLLRFTLISRDLLLIASRESTVFGNKISDDTRVNVSKSHLKMRSRSNKKHQVDSVDYTSMIEVTILIM